MKAKEAIQLLSKLDPDAVICIDWWTVEDVEHTAIENGLDYSSIPVSDLEDILERTEEDGMPDESNRAIRNLFKTEVENLLTTCVYRDEEGNALNCNEEE